MIHIARPNAEILQREQTPFVRSFGFEIPKDPATGALLVDFNLRFDVFCRVGFVVVTPMRNVVEVGVLTVRLAAATDGCTAGVVAFVASADTVAV